MSAAQLRSEEEAGRVMKIYYEPRKMAIKLSQRLPRFTPRNRRPETWHVCVWFPYFSPPSGCTIDVREVTNQR